MATQIKLRYSTFNITFVDNTTNMYIYIARNINVLTLSRAIQPWNCTLIFGDNNIVILLCMLLLGYVHTVCMCVCSYVFHCKCVLVYVHVSLHACMHVSVFLCTCMYVCVWVSDLTSTQIFASDYVLLLWMYTTFNRNLLSSRGCLSPLCVHFSTFIYFESNICKVIFTETLEIIKFRLQVAVEITEGNETDAIGVI